MIGTQFHIDSRANLKCCKAQLAEQMPQTLYPMPPSYLLGTDSETTFKQAFEQFDPEKKGKLTEE